MEERAEYTEEVVEGRISDTLERAKELVDSILASNNELIAEIKATMAKGIDMIPMVLLQEWSVAIPIIIEDIVSYREAYSLSRELWKIEERQMSAKNLLELERKKTDIHEINKVAGTAHKKREAIAQYIQSILAGHQEALWVLSTTVRRMIEIKMASGVYV